MAFLYLIFQSNYNIVYQRISLYYQSRLFMLEINQHQQRLPLDHRLTIIEQNQHIYNQMFDIVRRELSLDFQSVGFRPNNQANQMPCLKGDKVEQLKQQEIITQVLSQRIEQLTNRISETELTLQKRGDIFQENLYDLGNKLEVLQSKLYSAIDNLKGGLQIQEKVATDIIQSAISISKHCPYFNQYNFHDSIIQYKGKDKQATQLLSQKIIDYKAKTSFDLNVFNTKASCIKFGVIDRKYISERSSWNYPNTVYYHGWGHVMTGGLEKQYPFGGFNSGDFIRMIVEPHKGIIRWEIKRNFLNFLQEQIIEQQVVHKALILMNKNIDWVPFIAMYNHGDKVEWKIVDTA